MSAPPRRRQSRDAKAARGPADRERTAATSSSAVSRSIKRFVARKAEPIACSACKHPAMEIADLQPNIFLGGARLLYRCPECGASHEDVMF